MKYSRIPWKCRVREPFAYKLQSTLTILREYSDPYFTLTADGWLLFSTVYAWDGATKFPDFDWIKTPSAIHDALHQAIKAGCIPESENNLIDRELNLAICGNDAARASKRALLKIRGWYVERATNTAHEKKADELPPIELPKLVNEYTMEEYKRFRELEVMG